MIENETQYKITQQAAERFRASLKNMTGFKMLDMLRKGIDPKITEMMRKAEQEQLATLEEELREYEAR